MLYHICHVSHVSHCAVVSLSRFCRWHHPKCFVIPSKLKKEGVTVETFVDDMLVDNTQDNSLQEHRDEIIADIEYVAPKGSAKKRTAGGDDDEPEGVVAKLKAQLQMLRSQEGGESSTVVAAKKPRLSPHDMARVDVYAMYETYTNDALKDILTWNRQIKTGNRNLLMARIIDGQLKGRLGRCPMCIRGRMQLENDHARQAICKGYYNEDIGAHESCNYTCLIDDAPRNHPW